MREYRIPSFQGAINEAVAENLIKVTEAKKAQNVNVDDGNLNSCGGISLYASAPAPIGSMMAYYKNNAGKLLLACSGTLYKYENGTFVSLGSGFTSDKFDYVNFKVDEEVIIFGNGVEPTFVYNDVAVSYLKNRRKVYNTDGTLKGYVDANGVFYATEAEVTTLAPKSNKYELHYERIWAADDNSVYFSTADVNGFDYQDWTAPKDDELEVNQHGGQVDIYTNDGGKIIGLKVIYDDVMVFKTKSLFKIFGNYPGNYQKIQVFSSNGAIADKSIVASNVGAFFANKDAIYLYDGTNVAPISQKIQKTYESVNKDYIEYSVAILHKNKYIIAVPEGTSMENNLIIEYDVLNKNFIFRRGFVVTDFIEFEDKLLFSSTDGKVYEYNIGDTFNGVLIDSYYETGISDWNYPEGVKEIDYLYMTANGTGSVKITCNADSKVKEKIVALTATDKIYPVKINTRGRLINFKFSNVNGSKFALKSVKILFDLDLD